MYICSSKSSSGYEEINALLSLGVGWGNPGVALSYTRRLVGISSAALSLGDTSKEGTLQGREMCGMSRLRQKYRPL